MALVVGGSLACEEKASGNRAVVGASCPAIGTLDCDGNLVIQCDATGKWRQAQDCSSSAQTCNAGLCVSDSPQCPSAGHRSCADATTLRVCGNNLQATRLPCPTGQRCQGADGAAQCTSGPATGSCTALGQTFCVAGNSSVIEACDGNLQRITLPCNAGESCQEDTAGRAVCARGSGGTCPGGLPGPGSIVCASDGTRVEVVTADCGRLTTQLCQTNQECDPVNKGCRPKQGTGCCDPGARRCSPLNERILEICQEGGCAYVPEVCDVKCVNAQCLGGADDDIVEMEPEVQVSCSALEPCPSSQQYCHFPAGSTTGECRPFCERDDDCELGWQCDILSTRECKKVPGFCRLNTDCANGEVCIKSAGADWGSCRAPCTKPGHNCTREGTKCVSDPSSSDYGRCVPQNGGACADCVNDFECAPAGYCARWAGQTSGCCAESCRNDAACPPGTKCDPSGRCIPGDRRPDCGGPCPSGHICDAVYGQCVLNCPPCRPQYCCDTNSAPNCYRCECTNPVICGFGLQQCCQGYRCSAIVYGVLGFCI